MSDFNVWREKSANRFQQLINDLFTMPCPVCNESGKVKVFVVGEELCPWCEGKKRGVQVVESI